MCTYSVNISASADSSLDLVIESLFRALNYLSKDSMSDIV